MTSPCLTALQIEIDPTSPPPIPVRVQHGIALLDSRLAGNARALRQLDLDRLDFFSLRSDVLGQTYGTTANGLAQFDLTAEEAIAVGFDCADGEERELTDEWIRQVEAIRGALPRRPAVTEEVAA